MAITAALAYPLWKASTFLQRQQQQYQERRRYNKKGYKKAKRFSLLVFLSFTHRMFSVESILNEDFLKKNFSHQNFLQNSFTHHGFFDSKPKSFYIKLLLFEDFLQKAFFHRRFCLENLYSLEIFYRRPSLRRVYKGTPHAPNIFYR